MKRSWLLPLVLLPALGFQGSAVAHGIKIDHQTVQAVQINAIYDTGEPMADAQVAIYTPDNPSEPWLTGTTDAKGHFIFTPDPTKAGNWEVSVRQAGHGGIVNVSVRGTTGGAEPNPTADGLGNYTPLQKGVMAGAVIWGFVGTALFFSRRKQQNAHS
ncbi:MAG: carboxypeptidase regulatory-like domain-containing protein [Cyanobacteria bacterium CRU_2_1]|nr:carboxypeptidase regulatory-like domain-containing protein [Cyanobacteria bacterium RU_5_0]NJR58489.1 carboxypeptidase regulatory-like domain-containing protein [Cyanobacteria bacterium CRU_2_1]NJR58513.1 carboxypeptidase regulatory-like domain-containing protein [Cyanobacteria bacterium CRU_2_1]